jgi:hypothetical protein
LQNVPHPVECDALGWLDRGSRVHKEISGYPFTSSASAVQLRITYTTHNLNRQDAIAATTKHTTRQQTIRHTHAYKMQLAAYTLLANEAT